MDELQSGDKIVDLGAMVRSVTTASGAISAALLLLLAKQNSSVCWFGFALGAVSGVVLGLILAWFFYADGKGNVNVVKATPTNFPITWNAALKGALIQTFLILLALGASGKIAAWPLAVGVALVVNLLIAFSIARLALS